MSESSSDEEDEEYNYDIIKKHPSIKQFTSKNNLIMEIDKINQKKRCSSASVNYPKIFAPQIKPIKAILCPSPILLDEKPPKFIKEVQNTTISTSSFDSKNEFKRIKIKSKISIKLISEKVYPISDCEEDVKKGKIINSDSDSSKNGEKENTIINLKNKNKINYINKMRIKMKNIRKNSINDVIFDDSNIGRSCREKALHKNIKITLSNKLRSHKNKNLYPLNNLRYRNKSFSSKTSCIPTILGFLERNKSSSSLNSMGK